MIEKSLSNQRSRRMNSFEHHNVRTHSAKSSRNSNSIEFLEHPQSSLLTGELPVLVQCTIKNAAQTLIECDANFKDSIKRTVSRDDDTASKVETLSLFIRRTDFERNVRRIICRCVAYSDVDHKKVYSQKAIIKNSCNYLSLLMCLNIF